MEAKKPKEKSYRWLIAIVAAVSVLGIVVCLYGTLCMGEITPNRCFIAFLNIALYISFIKYTIQYFGQGKDITITSMLVRYAASLVGTLLAVREGSTAIFIMTAMTMIFVPFVAGDLKKPKRNLMIMAVILVMSSVVALLMVMGVQVTDDPGGFGTFVRYYMALNQCIQWILFVALYVIRGLHMKVNMFSD